MTNTVKAADRDCLYSSGFFSDNAIATLNGGVLTKTGMVAYQRRFYRPDLCRWLNRDPIEEEGGENLYAFCCNNSALCIDAFGNFSIMNIVDGVIQIASIMDYKALWLDVYEESKAIFNPEY